MGRTSSPLRRAWLSALAALALSAPCCGSDLGGPQSQVTTLRVIALTASEPYVAKGDVVTFQMTYDDALGSEASGGSPRAVQVMWIAGCKNPIGGAYEACFPQLLGAISESPDLVKSDSAGPTQSGVPGALSFDWKVPEDIFDGAELAKNGSKYTTAYVFFAVCAGTLRFALKAGEGAAQAAALTSLPLECVDEAGSARGGDSFVAGYTQVFAFEDGRSNSNPTIDGMTLDGVAMEGDPESAPVVPRCAAATSADQPQGCGAPDAAEDCKALKIAALVGDVAEEDVESSEPGGAKVLEGVWVDYLADGGSFAGARRLVNDVRTGYHEDHATEWTPPSEAGLVSIWAVVHDARGGQDVVRRFVRVE